jgi:uncharacterized repeat protein (TIGR01451 family)
MRISNKINQLTKRVMAFGMIVGVAGLIVGGVLPNANAAEVTLSGAADCDANAVVYCGATRTSELIGNYNNGTSQNSAQSIQNIYGGYGITSADINNMTNTAVAGHVTKAGQVFIDGNGTAVANNAQSSGRQQIAGETAASYNGTTYYTGSTTSGFRSDSLPAFVVMKNGAFQFAVLRACANPVIATAVPAPAPQPTPQPNYTIVKQVSTTANGTYAQNNNVTSGQHVFYRVTVASTGNAPVTNLVVKDILPAGVTYVDNTLIRDGAAIANPADNQFFVAGVIAGTLNNGSSTTYQFEAIVANGESAQTCQAASYNNIGAMTATGLPTKEANATVAKECSTAPMCTILSRTIGDNRLVTISNFQYQANGATFKNAVINWGDNTATGQITDTTKVIGQTHQYDNKAYTMKVAITFSQNGSDITVSGAGCQQPIPSVVTAVSTTTPTPPVAPTPPSAPVATTLVNTGPGSVALLFGAAAIIGTFGYRIFLGRRLTQN